MSNKILEITERVPRVTNLPDGNYNGKWGGYVITVQYKDKVYECKTEDGVRGFNINVMVTIKDGVATFVEVNN
tara:strand:- start:485 stop:703 length:219 start_codon:yes stop_codon:yes gene_type:complete